MKDNKLATLSIEFSADIINPVRELKEKRENIISNQIGRSGTSIGANIREAKYAHGKVNFIPKLQISLKEANETGYRLELLYGTDCITKEQYENLSAQCIAIIAMLVSSIKTVKSTEKQN